MDKNRKRGIRIAQKATYRHHEHDNFAKPRGWRLVFCFGWDDHPSWNQCPGCLKLRYWRSGGTGMDDDWNEYLCYGDHTEEQLEWDYHTDHETESRYSPPWIGEGGVEGLFDGRWF